MKTREMSAQISLQLTGYRVKYQLVPGSIPGEGQKVVMEQMALGVLT
jgi:hypothetical protein